MTFKTTTRSNPVVDLLISEARQLASDLRALQGLERSLAERRGVVLLRLWSTYRLTYADLAELTGLSVPRIGQIIDAERRRQQVRDDAEQP